MTNLFGKKQRHERKKAIKKKDNIFHYFNNRYQNTLSLRYLTICNKVIISRYSKYTVIEKNDQSIPSNFPALDEFRTKIKQFGFESNDDKLDA